MMSLKSLQLLNYNILFEQIDHEIELETAHYSFKLCLTKHVHVSRGVELILTNIITDVN